LLIQIELFYDHPEVIFGPRIGMEIDIPEEDLREIYRQSRLLSDPFQVLEEGGLHNSLDEHLSALQGSDLLLPLPAIPHPFDLEGLQEAHLVGEAPAFSPFIQHQLIPVVRLTPPKINQWLKVLDERGDQAGGKTLGPKRVRERLPLLQLSLDHFQLLRKGKELQPMEDEQEARHNTAQAKEDRKSPPEQSNLLAHGWGRDHHASRQA
jgi:hypothetical protein